MPGCYSCPSGSGCRGRKDRALGEVLSGYYAHRSGSRGSHLKRTQWRSRRQKQMKLWSPQKQPDRFLDWRHRLCPAAPPLPPGPKGGQLWLPGLGRPPDPPHLSEQAEVESHLKDHALHSSAASYQCPEPRSKAKAPKKLS